MNQAIVFQETLVTTGTAQILPNAPIQNKVLLQAASGNAAVITFGNSPAVTSSTGYPLAAGDVIEFNQTMGNTNQLWAVGTSGDKYYIIGS